MRKAVSLFLISALLSGTSAYAATAELTDVVKGVISISGQTEANSKIKILITNPGFTEYNADEDGARQYADSIRSGADGTYSYKILLNTSGISSGDFNIYIKEGNNDTVKIEPPIYFASVSQKYQVLKDVIGDPGLIASNESSADIIQRTFGLTTELYKNIDMNKVAYKLSKDILENPIITDDSESDEIKLQKFTDMAARIKTISVIEAFNQGKSAILYGEDNSFKYNEVIDFEEMDNAESITAYKLYFEKLSDDGKSSVRNSLMNKDFMSIDQIKRYFVKMVMYYGISQNAEKGYGHISDYITEKNTSYALNTAPENLPIKGYLSLSKTDKNNVNYTIYGNASQLTADNFLNKIEEYSKKKETPGTGSKGNSSNTSSDSSKGGSWVVPEKNAADNQTVAEKDSIFKDIEKDFWARKAIEYLYENNIINGMDENNYAPNDYLTREQAVSIVCRMINLEPGIPDGSFLDVNNDGWYAPYVYAAKSKKVVNGIDANNFGVGMYITRQDVAVIICNAMGYDRDSTESGLSDFDSVSDYAKASVAYMNKAGIINGYSDSSFKPQNNITRAEIAQIIYNVLTKNGGNN